MAEKVVATVGELQDGQMKADVVGGRGILLVRVDGQLYALGAKCTHYGGPLAKGALCGHRVLCPWHQACFNVVTGKVDEPPALDDLAQFEVRVRGDQVIVCVPDEPSSILAEPSEALPVSGTKSPDSRTFVILGAGAAGHAAAEMLRREGFTGRIVLITREPHLPYDRPRLTKGYLAGKDGGERPYLRPGAFFSQHRIEVLCDREVVRVERPARRLCFADGSSLHYDALLLATGGTPRRLDLPGVGLGNIFSLRSLDDADRIIAALAGVSRVVIIGASFIGMETAASLTERGLSVTIVAPDSVPFERVFGKEIGLMFQKLHEENGVSFRLGAKVMGFEGTRQVQNVLLEKGERLPADLVLLGVGVRPNTDFLKDLPLNLDGSVLVDERLSVSQDIYAAGDIAQFPDWRTGQPTRIEHWRLAQQHGRLAAQNMLGQHRSFTSVPFFWTNQFGVNLRYVGHTRGWDEIVFHGDPAERAFVAFYVRQGQVLAAAGVANDSKMAAINELMRLGRMPSPDELKAGAVNFSQELRKSSK